MTTTKLWLTLGTIAGGAALFVTAGSELEPVDAPATEEHVVYVVSEAMPLSTQGVPEIRAAAAALGLAVEVVDAATLYTADPDDPRVREILAAGATTHFPSLLVYRGGGLVGPAILGYKLADTYRSLIRARLDDQPAARSGSGGYRITWDPRESRGRAVRDFEVSGTPGAYFRWVPNYDAVAYETSRTVYLLDLEDGSIGEGPGYIDFVPTPDGAWFVTPGEGRQGLEFYDAAQVFAAEAENRGAGVRPVYNDREMRDQYPSIGILEKTAERTVYRVLTSWAATVVYRDYEVLAGDTPTFRRLGASVRPCRDIDLSIPIMSQDGMEVAGRDESTGTTKIFRIGENGACEEVLDLGLQARKVAWHHTGRRIAFGLARGANVGRATLPIDGLANGAEPTGIFVLDRDTGRMVRVAGSENTSRIAFPDFVGDAELVFLIPGSRRGASVFRVVDGIW